MAQLRLHSMYAWLSAWLQDISIFPAVHPAGKCYGLTDLEFNASAWMDKLLKDLTAQFHKSALHDLKAIVFRIFKLAIGGFAVKFNEIVAALKKR